MTGDLVWCKLVLWSFFVYQQPQKSSTTILPHDQRLRPPIKAHTSEKPQALLPPRRLRGLKDYSYRQDLTSRFELETKGQIKKMSKGMKQKVGIVAAFMHNPDILILDEPTSGLDPLMQNRFLELILEEKSKGKTILMSSHIFEEVERVCDRAGIIKNGRVITIEDFKDKKKKLDDLYIITLKEEDDSLLKSGLIVKKVNERKYEISVKNNYQEFLEKLSKFNVINIDSKRQTIEDIFMKYYGGDEK